MPKYLHIVNGDVFAEKLRASGIPGDILVWRESLYEGPVGLQMSDCVLLSFRAQYMNRRYGIPMAHFITNTMEQERALEHVSSDIDEVVLWFEHDLYDQLMLCYLLYRLSGLVNQTHYSLSLLSINHFPGIARFFGLGQLSADQVHQLQGTWKPVTAEQMKLTRRVWRAYVGEDPSSMNELLDADLSALPFLKDALEVYLGRFPSEQNGLSAVQQYTLELLEERDYSGGELFGQVSQKFMDYGLGDLQFWGILKSMILCHVPLIRVAAGDNQFISDKVFADSRLLSGLVQLTEEGRSVLGYERDHILMNGVDEWIGGVHLQGNQVIWRRNASTMRLVRLSDYG
ncbi:DUF1835 domain-containing protein [Paenibacillus aestuarii]|uniref:DUF1835 domain-containing protein n=1 Tax=Paenibacillus aestuarii TaxID=516965 RepID=A0ABW0K7B4_9BACL|nr:DUF1835 domain-containing protein [Paenibacillus aestuarii]